MDKIIDELLDIEWNMFKEVNNIGGKAQCQNNYKTFEIMRKSQYLAWNKQIRESYLCDLKIAEESGRNLLAEKYGHMMFYTHIDEYNKIKDQLPNVSEQTYELIEKIAEIHVQMEVEFNSKFPNIGKRGRSTDVGTTANIYLKGELASYSEKTLVHIYSYIKELLKKNENLIEKIRFYTVKYYGYDSLESAEANNK